MVDRGVGEAKGVEGWGILVGTDRHLVEEEEEEVEMSVLILWHVSSVGCMAIWPVTTPVLVNSRRHWGVATPTFPVEHSPNLGKKAQEGRGKGRQVRVWGLNVLYDEDGNSYPVDDASQLYIPLKFAQDAGDGEIEVEKENPTKN